jgi:protein TonB
MSFNRMWYKFDSYFYAFSRSLYREWEYPKESARKGESGIVRVNFSITKEGKVTNVALVETSGYPALDREVLRALRNMDNVPLPDSMGLNMLHVNGHFIYSLQGLYRLY